MMMMINRWGILRIEIRASSISKLILCSPLYGNKVLQHPSRGKWKIRGMSTGSKLKIENLVCLLS